jgi:adenosylhomocysteine nucleosidase
VAGALPPVLITFAIPHESIDLRLLAMPGDRRIVHTGIGLELAAATLNKALKNLRPEIVISAGYAGGLDPAVRVGDVVVDSQRSDPMLLSILPAEVRRGNFLSVCSPLESAAAKENAFRETGSLAVDMETAAIAAACSTASVPAVFVRAISDAASDELPLPFATTYDIARQRPRPVSVCLALLRSPSRIPAFIHFLRDLNAARAALTRTLVEFLTAYRGTVRTT